MAESGLVIAIDGPAGAGKSTIARLLAQGLGATYIDTGAMYRAVALLARERGVALHDGPALAQLVAGLAFSFPWVEGRLHTVVDGRDVSDAIRQPGAGDDASVVSQVAEVREALVELQRAMEPVGGVVMEGRDIGTVVFPDADLKVFLTASPRVRGTRRFEQLRARGEAVELAAVVAEVEARDRRDRGRPISPLRQAEDAVLLDTSELSIGQVVDALLSLARARQSMA